MASAFVYLRNRFVAELPLWRLRHWQLALLICWATWPWLAQWFFPDNSTLALAPIIVFLPIAYLVGSLVSAALPGFGHAYTLGMSFTIFFVAYLVIVSWRQRRVRSADA